MHKPITRRMFVNSLCLTAITPLALTEEPTSKTTSITIIRPRLEKLDIIDSHFVSVDGWILPTKTLTEGVI